MTDRECIRRTTANTPGASEIEIAARLGEHPDAVRAALDGVSDGQDGHPDLGGGREITHADDESAEERDDSAR